MEPLECVIDNEDGEQHVIRTEPLSGETQEQFEARHNELVNVFVEEFS